MKPEQTLKEYLVLCRGKWDEDKTPEQIQRAIDGFYAWHEQSVASGTMRPGQRLAREGKLVTRNQVIDGPFAEVKELVGGYWFILAASLEEAAALAGQNPCLACGLELEVRPVEHERASAYVESCETPLRGTKAEPC